MHSGKLMLMATRHKKCTGLISRPSFSRSRAASKAALKSWPAFTNAACFSRICKSYAITLPMVGAETGLQSWMVASPHGVRAEKPLDVAVNHLDRG